MKGGSDMLALVVTFLCWTKAEGDCSQAGVKISGDMEIRPGEAFSLSCAFTCLAAQHAAQLWKNKQLLVSISSSFPNVTLVLNVLSSTSTHTGVYHCRTEPPNTVSPHFRITMGEGEPHGEPSSAADVNADDVTEKPASWSPAGNLTCNCTQQTLGAAGLSGQIWFWMLLGKATIFLLSVASLAVRYRTG